MHAVQLAASQRARKSAFVSFSIKLIATSTSKTESWITRGMAFAPAYEFDASPALAAAWAAIRPAAMVAAACRIASLLIFMNVSLHRTSVVASIVRRSRRRTGQDSNRAH